MSSRRFLFRLERVRALREQFEDVSREQLAQSLSSRMRVQAELESALRSLDGARATQRGVFGAEAVSGTDLVAAQAYADRVERGRDLAREHLAERDIEVGERRSALSAAVRERQSLERLRDRQRGHHDLAALRLEQAAQDELATTRYRRPA